MTYFREKFGLSASSVWAIVVLILGFFSIMAFLINGGHSPEARSMLVLIGQGFSGLINIWVIYRATHSTNQRVEEVHQRAEEINTETIKVREEIKALNGNTPQPGSIPRVNPGEGYTPEH